MELTMSQISELFSTFLSSGGVLTHSLNPYWLTLHTHSFNFSLDYLAVYFYCLTFVVERIYFLLYPFHLVFIPNIQRLEKLNNQELSVIKGGRKEDEGGLSLIGIGRFDDNKKGNAYIRILFFKIRLPWW